jgi:uncharacterized protein (TIGR03086 family)
MPPAPLIDDLETAQHTFANLLEPLTPNDLEKPTVNDDWTVRDVINHVIDGDYWAAKHLRTGADDFTDTDYIGNRPAIDAARTAQEDFLAALAETGDIPAAEGSMPPSDVVNIRIDELIGHGWDIARATGQNTHLAPEVAARSLERVRATLTSPESRGEFFKPAQPAPPDASMADQLAAFAGKPIASSLTHE